MGDDGGPSPSTSPPQLTIGELAARTGLSIRNIRAYQSRGLLPGPLVRGRVGYYNEHHVARIGIIQRFQADGFNLAAIAALVDGGDAFLAELDQLRHDLNTQAQDGWIPVTEEEIRLSEKHCPGSIERFEQIGTIRVAADGTRLTSPRLTAAGWELNRLGVPPDTIIQLLLRTHRMVRTMGDVYVSVIRDRTGAAIEGSPTVEDVQTMRAVFDELTPPAIDIMTVLFEVVLAKEAPVSFERALNSLEATP